MLMCISFSRAGNWISNLALLTVLCWSIFVLPYVYNAFLRWKIVGLCARYKKDGPENAFIN